MNDSELFTEAFFERGSRLVHPHYERYLERLRNTLDIIHNDFPISPKPYLDLINNEEINACASKYKGKYFIGVNAGTIFMIVNLINRMLASNKLFPHIGDVEKESDTVKIFTAESYSIDHIDYKDQPTPNCKVRATYGQIMIDFVLDFVVAHEFAHIIFGHCDFLGNKYQVYSIEESLRSYGKVDPLFHQTLELDADMFSTNFGYSEMYNVIKENTIIPSVCRDHFKTWPQALTAWLFPVTLLNRIYARFDSFEKLDSVNHPPPSIRSRLIDVTLLAIFSREFSEDDSKKMIQQLKKVYKQVEVSFREVSQKQMDYEPDNFTNSELADTYIQKLIENTKVVRPQLKSYAFFDSSNFRMD